MGSRLPDWLDRSDPPSKLDVAHDAARELLKHPPYGASLRYSLKVALEALGIDPMESAC